MTSVTMALLPTRRVTIVGGALGIAVLLSLPLETWVTMKLMTMRKARQLAWSLGVAISIAETLIHH
jgi:hypothetical protein